MGNNLQNWFRFDGFFLLIVFAELWRIDPQAAARRFDCRGRLEVESYLRLR
jgi:hypothetical protein